MWQVRDGRAVTSRGLTLKPAPQLINPVLDAQQFSHDASQQQAAQDDEDVIGFEGELDADDEGQQAQAMHDRLAHPLGQARAHQCAQYTAHQDGDDVDDGAHAGHCPTCSRIASAIRRARSGASPT